MWRVRVVGKLEFFFSSLVEPRHLRRIVRSRLVAEIENESVSGLF